MFSKTWSVLLVVYLFSDFSHGQKDTKFFREDYSYLETAEGFYKIHTKTQTWAEAKQVCALEGASLFHPDNRDEANAVISFWNRTQPNIVEVHVGLSDIKFEGLFETVDGKLVSEVYNQWKHGDPNNNGGNEDCVQLYLNGNLDDRPCNIKNNFICKKSLLTLERNYNCNLINSDGQRDTKFFREDYSYLETAEGFYKIHTKTQTWAEAKQVCALEGASLFYPDNRDEANAVISFWNRTQPKFKEVHVGLSDITYEGQFETVDGKLVSEVYNQWKQHEPNNYGGNEDCVLLYLNGNVNDSPCNVKYNFICKKSLLTLERNYNCNLINSAEQMAKKFFRKDYSYIETSQGFYKIHTISKTFADAKRECDLEGASLFYPDNRDEAQAVIALWNRTQPTIPWVYMGISALITKGVFETIDNKPFSKVYKNWMSGEPNNALDKEDCVLLNKDGTYFDYRCDNKYQFICKKTLQSLEWNDYCNMPDLDYTFNEDNGKCYKFHTTPLKWTEAYAVCSAEQSYLAVISNRSVADYLVKLTESAPKQRVKGSYLRGIYHVGFHNMFNKGWQTVKGTPLNDTEAWWGNYLPEADDWDQCGSMFFNGLLTHINCDMRSFFICEHEEDSASQNEEIFSN